MRWINELVINEVELRRGMETSLREERKRMLLDKLDQTMRDWKMSCGFWGGHRVQAINHNRVSVRVTLGRYPDKLPDYYLVEARPYFGGGFGSHVTGGGIEDDGTRDGLLNTLHALFDQMVDWGAENCE